MQTALRTGNFGGQLLAEIPGSHPCYLMKGMYLLPAATAMTRAIIGTATGTYSYNSITPDGTSILLQDVATRGRVTRTSWRSAPMQPRCGSPRGQTRPSR